MADALLERMKSFGYSGSQAAPAQAPPQAVPPTRDPILERMQSFRNPTAQPTPAPQADTVFGYKVRPPVPGEDEYFKNNPDVAGMATDDGMITLNPYSKNTPEQQQAVARNEAARLFMEENQFEAPPVTKAQRDFFKGTDYEKPENEKYLRKTIIGRIISGDASAGETTPEQRAAAQRIQDALNRRDPLLREKASPSSMPTEQQLYEQELQNQLQQRSGWLMDYLPGPLKDVASAAVGYASDMAGVGLRGSAAVENTARALIPDRLEGAAGFVARTALPGLGQAVLPRTPMAREKLDLANRLQQTSEVFDQEVNKARGDGTIAWARRMGTGALRSGANMLTGALAGGPYGAVALGGATEASQKYGELERKGASEAEQLGWATAAGVWESTVGAILNKVFGGNEKLIGDALKGIGPKLWKMPLKDAAKEVLKAQGKAQVDEQITEQGHLAMSYADGTRVFSPDQVLGDVLRTARDTAMQTAMLTTGAQTATQLGARAEEKRAGETPFGQAPPPSPPQARPVTPQTPPPRPAAPVTSTTPPPRPSAPQTTPTREDRLRKAEAALLRGDTKTFDEEMQAVRDMRTQPQTPRPIPREELEAIRAKGPVSRKDGQKLGLTEDQMDTQKTRTEAVDLLIEQEKQRAASIPQDQSVPEEAGQVGPGGQVPGGSDLRGTGEEQVPAQPAGQVAPAPEVQVAEPPAPTTKSISGTHISSNLDSLSGGFVERNPQLGVSIARSTQEEQTSPTSGEQRGRFGRANVTVQGNGLDYKNPEHRQYIDSLLEQDSRNVIPNLRKAGIDFVENWNSVGEADELHVLNPKAITVDSVAEMDPKQWRQEKRASETPTHPTPRSPVAEAMSAALRKQMASREAAPVEAPPVKSKGRTAVPKPPKSKGKKEAPAQKEYAVGDVRTDLDIANQVAETAKGDPNVDPNSAIARGGEAFRNHWMDSDNFTLTEVPIESIDWQGSDKNREPKSSGPIVIEVNRRKAGGESKVIVLDGQNRLNQARRSGAKTVLAWVGDKAHKHLFPSETAKAETPKVEPPAVTYKRGDRVSVYGKDEADVMIPDLGNAAPSRTEPWARVQHVTGPKKGQLEDVPLADLKALRPEDTAAGKAQAEKARQDAEKAAQSKRIHDGLVDRAAEAARKLRKSGVNLQPKTKKAQKQVLGALSINTDIANEAILQEAIERVIAEQPEPSSKPPKKPPVKNVAEAVQAIASRPEQEERGSVSEASAETGPVEFIAQRKGANAPGVGKTVLARSGERILHIEQPRDRTYWSIVEKGRYTGEVQGTSAVKSKDTTLVHGISNIKKAKDVAARILRGEFDQEGDLRFEKKDTKNLGLNNSSLADEIKDSGPTNIDRFATLLQERGWMTDGKMLVKLNDKDKTAVLASIGKFTTTRSVPIDDILKVAEESSHYSIKQLAPVAYRGGDIVRREVVLQSKDGEIVIVDKALHDTVMKKHPKAKLYGPDKFKQVAYMDGGEVVGVVMPIKEEKKDAHLKSLEKGTYWDSPLAQKPTRQPSARTKAKAEAVEQAKKAFDKSAKNMLGGTLPGVPNPKLVEDALKLLGAVIDHRFSQFRDFVAYVKDLVGEKITLKLAEYLESGWRDLKTMPGYEHLDEPSDIRELLGKKPVKKAQPKAAPKAEPKPASNWQDSVTELVTKETTLPELFQQLQAKHSNLTLDEFKQGMLDLANRKVIRLSEYTRAEAEIAGQEEAIRVKPSRFLPNGALFYFARPGEGKPVPSQTKNPEPPPRKEPPAPLSGTVGTKNAKTDELRDQMGLPPRDIPERMPVDEMDAEAARRMKDDPQLAGRLAEELVDKPRAVSEVEDFILKRNITDLKNRRNAGEDVDDDLMTAIEASELVGTIWGRMGVARQVEMAADFSLEGLVRKHFQTVGERPSKEMLEKLEALSKRIEEQDAELAELRKRKTDEEIDALIEAASRQAPKPAPKEKIGTKKERIKRQISEGVLAFKTAWNEAVSAAGDAFTFSGGLNPEAMAALGRAAKAAAWIIKSYAELGVESFLELTARIKQDIGELTAEQSKIFREEWDKLFADTPSPMGPTPTDPMIGATARELTRYAVESGITDREEVIDVVHAQLQAWGVEQTRSETMRAMSGYGDFRELPTDTVSVTVLGIKGEIQQLLKLEAMQAGQAPEKTGVERREPTEAERQLIKDVNEAKKKGGYTVTDPKRQLKSALDTAKTTVKNALTDTDLAIKALEDAIATRTPLAKPEGRTPGPTDADLEDMKAQLAEKRARRNELRAEYDRIFPPKRGAMSDANRLKMAESLLKRLNDQLEADIAAGNLDAKQQGTPLTSPTLEAERKRRTELKAALKAAREASPEYLAKQDAKETERYKQSLERRQAFWQKRLDDALKGVSPTPKQKKTRTDSAILEKKYQIEKTKRQAQGEIEELARKNRSKSQKVLGFGGDLLDLSRLIMTAYEMSAVLRQGAYYTLGFPLKALPAVKDSVLAAFSRRADFALHDNLMQRPNHRDYVAGNLETTADDGPLSHREEMFRSRLASQLAQTKHWALAPLRWAAEGAMGSERAFRTFSNTMRADLFDHMKAAVEASRPGTWTEEDAKIIGNASNIFGGRAPLKHGVAWGRVFFAPSWVWSRAQLIVGAPAWKGDKATRLAVGKVYVRAAVGMAAFHVLRHFLYSLLAGDDEERKPKYEIDMRSSDFGKTRLGETRLDSGTGVNQLLTLGARLGTGTTKNAKGEIVPIRGEDVPFTGSDAREIVHRFLDTKLAPLPSGVLDWIAGETVVGEPATVGTIVSNRLQPMTWRDIWDAEKELNVPQGTVAAIEAFFGTGISTYGPRSKYRDATPEQRQEQFDKYLEKMQWDEPDPAYSEFLTTEQSAQVAKRREQRRGELVFEALRESPDERVAAAAKDKKKSPYKDAEALQKAQEAFQKDQASFAALKAQVSLDEAERLLAVRYAGEMGTTPVQSDGQWLPSGSAKKNAAFKERRKRLRAAYQGK